jgi:hypothetical protein
MLACICMRMQWIARSCCLPKPGEGPSVAAMDKGFLRVTTIGSGSGYAVGHHVHSALVSLVLLLCYCCRRTGPRFAASLWQLRFSPRLSGSFFLGRLPSFFAHAHASCLALCSGSKVKSVIFFPTDQGYRDTARMLVESGISLLLDKDKIAVGRGTKRGRRQHHQLRGSSPPGRAAPLLCPQALKRSLSPPLPSSLRSCVHACALFVCCAMLSRLAAACGFPAAASRSTCSTASSRPAHPSASACSPRSTARPHPAPRAARPAWLTQAPGRAEHETRT